MNHCIFCQIVVGQIPSKVVINHKQVIVILDAFPLSLGHSLVISKQHYPNWSHTPTDVLTTITTISQRVSQIIKQLCPEIVGFNYLSNEGQLAGQSVFHTHLHIIPKYHDGSGLVFMASPQKQKIDQEAFFLKLKKQIEN